MTQRHCDGVHLSGSSADVSSFLSQHLRPQSSAPTFATFTVDRPRSHCTILNSRHDFATIPLERLGQGGMAHRQE
jgi:hypothetical protein